MKPAVAFLLAAVSCTFIAIWTSTMPTSLKWLSTAGVLFIESYIFFLGDVSKEL